MELADGRGRAVIPNTPRIDGAPPFFVDTSMMSVRRTGRHADSPQIAHNLLRGVRRLRVLRSVLDERRRVFVGSWVAPLGISRVPLVAWYAPVATKSTLGNQ
jgi:hypothetical protein